MNRFKAAWIAFRDPTVVQEGQNFINLIGDLWMHSRKATIVVRQVGGAGHLLPLIEFDSDIYGR